MDTYSVWDSSVHFVESVFTTLMRNMNMPNVQVIIVFYMFYSSLSTMISHLCMLKGSINLLRTAGRFIDQKRKGPKRIISITIANKEVALMQM